MDDCSHIIYQSKAFSDVIKGKFPEDAVKRMTIYKLRGFVVDLVKYTSAKAGKRSVSVVNRKNKPRWWPRDVLFEFDSLFNDVKSKEFRVTLQQVVEKCCEFFRNKPFERIWLSTNRTESVWINDENFDSVKTRGVKRKKDITEANSVKRKKTLTSKNESAVQVQVINRPVKAVVYLHDIFKVPKKPESPTQQQFLKSLGLIFNNNYRVPASTVPHVSKLIKLHNCPNVPISSDVGKAIIKRENYTVPEDSTTKKIERLEWYVNRSPPKKTPQHYEVTYVDNKVSDLHIYKFPKKQFHQRDVDKLYTNFLLKLCKPLYVVVKQDDLTSKKKYCDSFNVTVSLRRLSVGQLNKYLCKNFKICLTKIVDNKTRSSRLLRSRTWK